MSWITVFMRSHGLGGVLDAVEAAEKAVGIPTSTAETQAAIGGIVGVITSGIAPMVEAEVASLGASAAAVVQGAIAKYAPGLATVSAHVEAQILAAIEAEVARILTPAAPAPEGG